MNRRDFLVSTGAAASLGLLSRSPVFGQATTTPPVQRPTPVTEFRPLRRNVGLFTGRGGTIGWLVNQNAVVAVDTQFADTATLFLGGLPGRDGRTLDAVIDSHHHWDHTGGNATFKPAAKKIVAHENVPALQTGAFQRSPQLGEPTLPDTLFADTWRMEAGDEIVSAKYFGPAHTGGDIAVYFEHANVVHVGDLLFNRLYPVTDRPGGCNFRGWITALEAIAKTYPADALYLYGHGKKEFGVTGGPADLLMFRDFLTAVVEHTEKEIKAGKSRAEIITLANLPGWPEFQADEKTSRLPMNLGAAYDELTGA